MALLKRRNQSLPVADVGDMFTSLAPEPQARPKRRSLQRRSEPVPPMRGWARAFGGRAPMDPPIPTFRGSTGQVQGLYPWLYGQGLPAVGPYIGYNTLTGGGFSFHPLELLRLGKVNNPNTVITGGPGTGKSGTVKTVGMRLIRSGVKMFIAGDVKGEYSSMARHLGVEPVQLGPGFRARLNPLDAGPLGRNMPNDPLERAERLAEIHRRRISLLSSLVITRLGRNLNPTEEFALSMAIQHASGQADAYSTLTDPTIPQVWALLRDPNQDMAREMRVDGESITVLREMVRPVADTLGTMVQGALSGLFDGPTTVGMDFTAPIQSVDLQAFDGKPDELVAMIMSCVSSWCQAAIDEPGGPVRMVVRDELWRCMRIPSMVAKIDSDLRLSRNQGTLQWLATHSMSDFEAVGEAGSKEVTMAKNLIANCDTRILLRQDTAPLNEIKKAIGLSDVECRHVASWTGEHVGRALWKIGRTEGQVIQVVLHPEERNLYYTNEKMSV